MEFSPGRRLGHYEIRDRLGKGGMGEVYHARDTKLNRDVAIKVLPAEFASDSDRRMRFEREAQAVAALNHPNIVTIHSVEQIEGTSFITMELVEGKTLTETIPEDGIPLQGMFEIAVPLSDALAAAHSKGITHRDLKPDNVMITEDGRVKVLDFGLAKLAESADAAGEMATATLTTEGTIMGTVAYMSPEQAEGKPVDARSDVFALGVLLYEMTTGTRPFEGDTRISTITAILRDTPPSLTEIRRNLPRHLSRIVNRCLAKEPDRRYQSALDVRNELDELRREVNSGEMESMPAQAPQPVPAAGSAKLVSRLPVVLGIVAVGLVLVLVSLWLLRREPSGSPPPASGKGAGPVAVLGFENLTDPADGEHLGRMLVGLITTGLAESGGIEVVSSAKVRTALKQAGVVDSLFDPTLAADAAELADAGTMLVGQIIAGEGRLVLTGELVDVATGNTLGSVSAEGADASELFAMAGGIAGQVRERLGVGSVEEGLAIDLAQSLTDSAEAYRLYASGEMALHERRFTDAIEHLTQAIRRDPTFALAYYQLGMAQIWHGDRGGALRNLHNGLQHIDRLPSRWQTTYRAVIDYEAGDVDSAYAALDALVAEGPEMPDPYNYLGEILTHYSKYSDISRGRDLFARALEIDPTYKVVLFHLIDFMLALDELDEARAVLARYEGDHDQSVLASNTDLLYYERRFEDIVALEADPVYAPVVRDLYALWDSLARTGEGERALELCTREVDENVGYSKGLEIWNRARLRISLGDFSGAIEDLEAAPDLFDSPVVKALAAMIHVTRALAYEIVGDLEAAIEAARASRQTDYFMPRGRFELARLLYDAGRLEEADRELAAFETMVVDSKSVYAACWLELATAERMRAHGDPRGALRSLASESSPACYAELEDVRTLVRARAYEADGDPDRALEQYRLLADPPWAPGNLVFELDILALYHVARLEQSAGATAEARRHYRVFLEHWGGADPPIPIAEEARRQLARLGE